MSFHIERRAFPRVAVSTRALVLTEGAVEGEEVTIVDISRGGARVRMTTPVAPQQSLRLMLRGAAGGWTTVRARVAATRDGHVGLSFLQVEPDAMALIEAMVASQPAPPEPSEAGSRQLGRLRT